MKENENYKEIWEKVYGFKPVEIDPTIPDLSNDPTVLQRAEEAKKMIESIKNFPPPNWRNRE